MTDLLSVTAESSADVPGNDYAGFERLMARRSCRAFQSTPVPRELIERMLVTAGRSPSWCNTQPWQMAVTSGADTERFRLGLSEYAAEHQQPTTDFPFPEAYTGKFQERRRESGWQLYDSVGIVKGDREGSARQAARNFALFGAPHVGIITTEADLGVYGVLDCGIFLQSFLLAAEALGIATIPQAALAACSPFIREWFGLPDNRLIVCGVSFGYADPSAPENGYQTSRAPLDELLTWSEGV